MTWHRSIVVSIVLMLAIAARVWLGGAAVVAVVVLALPLLGWAFDNDTGTFLVLGLLVTLVCLILVAMMSLLALQH